MAVSPNTPILVGAAAVEQRIEDPAQAKEATALMIEAVMDAAQQAGSKELLTQAQRVYVPKGMWNYLDPARLVADGIGAGQATTVLGEIGILQQTLIGDACQRIADGELDIAIVAGGEAKYRGLRAHISGQEAADTVQPEDTAPDIYLQPEAEIWSLHESVAGLGMPVGFYAIMESSLRRADGLGMDEHRDRIAAMYQQFSEVAADNPHAWNRQPVAASTIRDPGEKNPMLAFPYTKLHNTSWNVDQAAGLIFTSVGKARELGIDESQWIYPLASTESNYMQCLAAREELHGCPGAGASARAAFEASGLSAADIRHWELYSCFPIAVSIYAREAGVPADVPWTVTGGMPFAGGPLNNFVYQSTVRMIEKMREEGGTGMISCVSGMLTKQAWGLWSTEPLADFSFVDVTEEVRADHPNKSVINGDSGSGVIAGYTVLYQKGEAERAVAVIDLADGQRCVSFSEDATLIEKMLAEEYIGRTVELDEGRFSQANSIGRAWR